MNERYIKWYSPWLSRDFEMFVFGDKRGLPLLLFPTSGAHHYENKDFGLVGAIASYIDNGKVTVYCPDAIDRDESYGLSGILNSKGINHRLDDGKWRGHDWNYWRDMMLYYLSIL